MLEDGDKWEYIEINVTFILKCKLNRLEITEDKELASQEVILLTILWLVHEDNHKVFRRRNRLVGESAFFLLRDRMREKVTEEEYT